MKDFSTLGAVLPKSAQKRIFGGNAPIPYCYSSACEGAQGGNSCWHNADGTNWDCSLNQAQAQARQQSSGGFWCTASCCTSCIDNFLVS